MSFIPSRISLRRSYDLTKEGMGWQVKAPILVSISIVIIGLIVLGGIYDPFGTITQENDLKSNQFVMEPTTTSLEFESSELIPHTETISPESFIVESKSETTTDVVSNNEAFAIPSSQLTVTLTRWPGTLTAGSFNIRSLDIDSSNNVYWARTLGDTVVKLDPATNTITEWNVPPAKPGNVFASPVHVVIDLSDKLWWQEGIDGDTVRLDPLTNLMTQWDPGTTTNDIDVDSGNNIWFSSFVTNNLYKLDPATNQLTSWLVVPGTFSGPQHIVVDTSDNVWFLVENPDRIGRLVPSTNLVTIWAMPNPSSFQTTNDLAVDSTGKIFLGEDRGNGAVSKIGRFDPATNQLTEWDLPTSDNRTFGVGIDSADTVYVGVFSNVLPDKIVRLVPSTNVITEFTIIGSASPNVVSPTEPIIDSFDNVWFPEFSLGEISRLS